MTPPLKTTCKRGHKFTEQNTAWKICGRYRVRQCKRCNAERAQRKYYSDEPHRELIKTRALLRYYEKLVFKARHEEPHSG